jgi:hypothetical protein
MFDKIFGRVPDEAQGEDERKFASYIKTKIEEVRQTGNRISHEGTWMTNAAYLLGFNSVYYDTQAKQFKQTNTGGNAQRKSKLTVNKILPMVQNRVARLCKNPPRYEVRPNSSDCEDKDAARLSLRVLNARMEAEKINEKRIQLFMWVQQCGHAFVKTYWDSMKGRKQLDPMTGEMKPEGEICIDICSPFEIFVDPLAKSMDEAQWVIQAKVRKLDYFKTHYPQHGYLVKEENAWLLSTQYELRISTLNTMGPTTSGISQQMKNAAIELVYYEKPSQKYPNGRMGVAANGILLEDRDLVIGDIPFVKFDDVIIGGKFYSESLITHVRPLQDQINRLKSRRAEWTNKLLAGKYLAPRGSGLMQEALNDQNGEVVEYDVVPGAGEIKAMTIPNIPEYAYREEETLDKDLNEIFGLNEVSKGQLPSASIPAIGLQFLLEQDDTRLGIVTEQHENAWAKVGQHILLYATKCYENERLLKEAGKNHEYQIAAFRGADLKDNTDVIVVRGSTLPGSKVLKRQEILNTYDRGLLGNPADPAVQEKVLGSLEYGDIAEVWEDFAIDQAHIQRDIDQIEAEQPLDDVNELDNHKMHILFKNRYRKSEKFKKLSLISQQILIQNIEQHIQAEMRLQNPSISAKEKVDNESEQARQAMFANPGIIEDSQHINQINLPPEGEVLSE